MFISTSFTGMDIFANDLENAKTEDDQHLVVSQIVEELRDELERWGNDGEESYVYEAAHHEFHFTLTAQDGLTLSIHYTGYTEGF